MDGAADGSADRSRTAPRDRGFSNATPRKKTPAPPSPNGPPTRHCRSGGPSGSAPWLYKVAATWNTGTGPTSGPYPKSIETAA